jgi:hypothetical protein
MPTPEAVNPEVPQIQEINKEAEMPASEELISTGSQPVIKNFNVQVKDDKGQPMIQTPPVQVITVQPPYDDTTLTKQSKGSITSSLTWLSAFWIRVIKKALHYGWQIVSGSQSNP